MGVYPFMFGAFKDFEEVAQEAIKVGSIFPQEAGRNAHNCTERLEGAVRLGRVCGDLLSEG